jgi:hypothetical protein
VELTAEEVDQAVYLEVPSTLWEMQDRTLADLSSGAERDRVDIQKVFDKAQGGSRGGLTPKDVKRALQDSVPRSKATKEELAMLIKRYETANRDGSRSVDVKRLVDDLSQGRVAQPQSWADTTPRTRAADAAKLTELMKYIGGALNKGAGAEALFARFSQAERGNSSGVISTRAFTGELSQAGVHL